MPPTKQDFFDENNKATGRELCATLRRNKNGKVIGVCFQEKHHEGRHRDVKGITWLDGEVVASRASRVRIDGKCKNGHQVLIDGKPTDNAYEYPKASGKYRCRQCGKDYAKKSYHKDRQSLTVLEEALEKVGLEAPWFDFKTKCNQEKLEAVQAMGKLLQLPMLDPDVLDYLHQAEPTPTVSVETPGKVQDEPKQPSKFVDPFAYPEDEWKPGEGSSNIF